MRYLPHIEKAISRLGYIKPEYAPALAILMEENEGHHPHKIGRLFRQIGIQLSAQSKRDLGIRANADMTVEAIDALTEKGRTAPLKGLEATLLDAQFSYFRERSVRSGLTSGRDRFKIDGMFTLECDGCRRLDGEIATSAFLSKLPPPDCQKEACAIGIQLNIDFIQELVHKERVREAAQKKGLLARIFKRD
ncbi:hypothetical protein [Devosia naphthalenivorans]|uniref:hypothetical protein n=1 Tax=Devosia naphthalenivorans TaxID=2082392 RepID=UPI000D35D0BA|nr:hypothetical protein [Devosia naphthalenivorans]